jgi:hypothetical protein
MAKNRWDANYSAWKQKEAYDVYTSITLTRDMQRTGGQARKNFDKV